MKRYWLILILTIILIVYLAAGAFSECWLGIVTHHKIGEDFLIYYQAYTKARSGDNPYLPYHIGRSYVYHPFGLTFVSLFSWHSNISLAILSWALISVGAWLLSIFVVLRVAKKHFAPITVFHNEGFTTRFIVLIFLGFAPFWETIHIGQINTFVALFIYLALYFYQGERPLLSGVFLALAISLKTSPVVLVLCFLVQFRFRVVLSTLISLTALSIIPAIQFSPQILGNFLAILPKLGAEIHPTMYNQSILSACFRVFAHLGKGEIGNVLTIGHKIAFLVVLFGILLKGAFMPKHSTLTNTWLFTTILVITVFFSPLVWYHHSVLLLLPLTLLLLRQSKISFAVGMGLISLIQIDRSFEYITKNAAMPVLLAHSILLGIVIAIFLQSRWNVITNKTKQARSLAWLLHSPDSRRKTVE